ncbi:MAG: hypothetical protein N2050_03070 [Flavobacteriales bacterium]|nr:hypothetical protein [Flavobacteriales bacterium]
MHRKPYRRAGSTKSLCGIKKRYGIRRGPAGLASSGLRYGPVGGLLSHRLPGP